MTVTIEPDLYAMVLRLHRIGGASARPQGHGAQALFLDLVRAVQPALAEELHATAKSKPYTVAILSQTPDRIEIRVTLLRSDLFQPFVASLLRQAPGGQLRLGQAALALVDVIGTPAPQGHPWAGYASFDMLSLAARAVARVSLEFVTITAFSQGERANRHARLGLLPAPEAVFGSLARRWNELAPASNQLDNALVEAAIADTLVSRYRAESASADLGKGPQLGFIGSCRYELPLDPQQARLIALLADAAFYLGVGMKTARGMGLCRRGM